MGKRNELQQERLQRAIQLIEGDRTLGTRRLGQLLGVTHFAAYSYVKKVRALRPDLTLTINRVPKKALRDPVDQFILQPTPEELINEEWRILPAYPDYWGSSLGRIRFGTTGTPTFGYYQKRNRRLFYMFFVRGENGVRTRRTAFLAQQIAAAFLGPPPEGKPQVDHNDLNRLNNRPNNLEYVSQSENVLRSYRSGTRKKLRPCHYWSMADYNRVRELWATRLYSQVVIANMITEETGIRMGNDLVCKWVNGRCCPRNHGRLNRKS